MRATLEVIQLTVYSYAPVRQRFRKTPDAGLADFLLEQEVKLEEKHGIPFCPCQPL